MFLRRLARGGGGIQRKAAETEKRKKWRGGQRDMEVDAKRLIIKLLLVFEIRGHRQSQSYPLFYGWSISRSLLERICFILSILKNHKEKGYYFLHLLCSFIRLPFWLIIWRLPFPIIVRYVTGTISSSKKTIQSRLFLFFKWNEFMPITQKVQNK